MVTFYAQAPAAGQKPASADPYANNPDAGKQKFPLAAPAGKDSGAKATPLPGSTNTGAVDPATWKYGTAPAFRGPQGAKLWNPVKLKLQQGGKVTGGTVFSATDPLTYCAMANAGYDYIWTEMQHNDRDWNQAARMWRTCPHAKAVPGARIAYSDEREIQRATDAGALVIVVPTVDTVQEALERARLDLLPTPRQAQPGRRTGFRRGDVGRCARRLSSDHQRQHRAHPHDRDD